MMQRGIIAQPVDKEFYTPEVYAKIIEEREKIGREMIQVDYQPPSLWDAESLLMHLNMMWHIYERGDLLALSIKGMCLDLSLTKLLRVASGRIAHDLARAELAEPRNVPARKTKRKKADTWQNIILAIYEHGQPIAAGTILSEAIRIMQDQFERSKPDSPQRFNNEPLWGWIPEIKQKKGPIEYMRTPSRDSIIKLLKRTGIRDRDFENRGPYWFKKT